MTEMQAFVFIDIICLFRMPKLVKSEVGELDIRENNVQRGLVKDSLEPHCVLMYISCDGISLLCDSNAGILVKVGHDPEVAIAPRKRKRILTVEQFNQMPEKEKKQFRSPIPSNVMPLSRN